jgi:DNA-binding HxlR family transcriptional regulator
VRTLDIERRSDCPINLTMEVARRGVAVIRDIMLGNRWHFRDLLTHSGEEFGPNVLAARLKRLVAVADTRQDDPSHSQKGLSAAAGKYQLTPGLTLN